MDKNNLCENNLCENTLRENNLTVAILTLGCKVNQYESEAVAKLFTDSGCTLTENLETADIIIVNTCAVTAVSSKKSRQTIHRATRNPDAVIAVMGCYAQSSPQEISNIEGVNVIMGTADKLKVAALVEQALKNRDEKFFNVQRAEDITTFEELPHMPQRTRAFMKIENGCNNFCAYCIIPYLRGRVRSRSLDSIKAECELLAAKGYKEIVLTGIHIGAYGRDLGGRVTLVDAIKTVLSYAAPLRLRLGSLESAEMSDELIDLMKSDKRICNHVHLPLQAGSDEILKLMRRPYTTKIFDALTARLVKEIPDVSIGTDLIAGFPCEDEKLFAETLEFVKAQPFSKIHVFPFSAREGTVAATMENQVPPQIKKLRIAQLIEVSDEKELAFRKKLIGKNVEIIAETESENLFDGLTKNYVRVFVPANKKIKSGDVINVSVEKIFGNGVIGIKN